MKGSISTVAITDKNYDFYHDANKAREVAIKKGTVITKPDFIKISMNDYIRSGVERNRGNFVQFSRTGKMSIIPQSKVKQGEKWWQKVDPQYGRLVTKTKEELLEILKRRRDEVLYGKKFVIDENQDHYVMSDEKSVNRLAGYLLAKTKPNLTTMWCNKGEDTGFEITMGDMDIIYGEIIEHHAITNSQYEAMMRALLSEDGMVYDYINWDISKAVTNVR